MPSPRPVLALLLGLAALPHAANAADSLRTVREPRVDTRELRQPEVFGVTRLKALLVDVPGSPRVVTEGAIADRQAWSAAEAVRLAAGVSPDPSDPDRPDGLLVRGFAAAERTGSLRDGLRHPFARGPLDMVTIERVEALRGPLDAVYGDVGSAGGGANWLVRRSHLEPVRLASLGADGDGRVRGTFATGGPLGGTRVTSRVAGAYDHRRDDRSPGGDGSQWAIAPVVDWRITLRTLLTVHASHVERERRDDPGLPALAGYDELPSDLFLGLRGGDPRRASASLLGIEFRHDPEGEIRLRQFVGVSRNTDRGPLARLGGPSPLGGIERTVTTLDESATSAISQSEVVLRFLTGVWEHHAVVGLELGGARLERATGGTVIGPVPLSGTPAGPELLPGSATDTWEREDRTVTAYVGDLFRVNRRLRVMLGARLGLDAHRITAPSGLSDENRVTAFAPRAGFVLRTSARGRAHVAVQGGTRANERCIPCGDPDAPASARRTQVEAGWRQELVGGRFDAGATVYTIDDRDALERSPDEPSAPANILPHRRSRGLELEGSGMLTDDLRATVRWAWTDARVVDPGASALAPEAPLARVPRHAIAADAVHRVRDGALAGLDVGLGVAYDGERDVRTGGPLRLPSATTWSAMLGYGRGPWNAQLNALNLTDVRAWDAAANGAIHPREPRTLRGTLAWRF